MTTAMASNSILEGINGMLGAKSSGDSAPGSSGNTIQRDGSVAGDQGTFTGSVPTLQKTVHRKKSSCDLRKDCLDAQGLASST